MRDNREGFLRRQATSAGDTDGEGPQDVPAIVRMASMSFGRNLSEEKLALVMVGGVSGEKKQEVRRQGMAIGQLTMKIEPKLRPLHSTV